MELVYVSVLEAEFCEFESHPVHQSLWSGTRVFNGSGCNPVDS